MQCSRTNRLTPLIPSITQTIYADTLNPLLLFSPNQVLQSWMQAAYKPWQLLSEQNDETFKKKKNNRKTTKQLWFRNSCPKGIAKSNKITEKPNWFWTGTSSTDEKDSITQYLQQQGTKHNCRRFLPVPCSWNKSRKDPTNNEALLCCLTCFKKTVAKGLEY